MTTTTPIDSDLQQQDDHEDHGHGHGEHPDLRMFGLATFLVADGMTFAGFFASKFRNICEKINFFSFFLQEILSE